MGLVTLQVGPFVDTIGFSDGSSLTLGSVSVLSILERFTRDRGSYARALEVLSNHASCMISVEDDNEVRAFLQEAQPRFSRKYFSVDTRDSFTMDRNLKVKLAALQMSAALVSRAEKASGPGNVPAALLAQLKVAAEEFCQGCNAIGEASAQQEQAPVAEASAPSAAPVASTPPSTAGDLAIAEQTLSLINTTTAKIDTLVAAGKKFNANRAKGELLKVAQSVFSAQQGSKLDSALLASAHTEAKRIAALFPLSVYPTELRERKA